jgi:Divergent InlB B-repeat domain
VRRHAMASSARSKARKPSGLGSSTSSGRLRLTILLATVAAFLLVPASQAFAAEAGHLKVNVAGSGHGEVNSTKGFFFFGGILKGEPPVECSGPPSSGVCETEENEEFVALRIVLGPSTEFTGWTVEQGEPISGCEAVPSEEELETAKSSEWGEAAYNCVIGGEEGAEVTANFKSLGPTNRRTLTLTKSAGGTGGIGSVTSKPKGINCGTACNSAVASMYESTPVTLTEKPATGSTFKEWTGACSGSSPTCTVPMSANEEVGAVYEGTSKAIANPQELTLTKGESTGQGTVKATGLTCENECTSTVALYQGPTGIAPKNKPGKTVELKATAAFGSTFTGWSGSGCSGTGVCKVTMEEAKEVTATFTAKPTAALTVNKSGTGTGTVTSKPKAINCATTCTTQSATVPTGESIVLKEKPATGSFEGWSGGGCSGTAETCTVSLSEAGTVTAKFGGTAKPIANAQELTLNKAGSGYGTIKGTGLTCEVLCTSTVSLYQGPTGVAPKNKPGKTVVLKALSAPGSAPVEWSGCLSNPSPTECSVTMEEAEEVTATFNELP